MTKLADEKYVAFTTFRKDGTPKPTPVWLVDAGDGKLGFITSSTTWKVKRLANNPRVELQPSDSRGRVTADSRSTSGTAEVLSGEAFDEMRAKVSDKYGFQLKLINFIHSLPGKRTGHANDCAVVVTLDEG